MVRDALLLDTSVELSRLSREVTLEASREVTLEGSTVKVRIYRLRHCAKWMLVVMADEVYTFYDASFDSDTAAVGAFQFTVQDKGISTFLDGRHTETIH